MPGGSLQNYLCNKRNISALNWKIRAQIVADIASGLQFLHSSKPKKIVHGNLKPENLFLDSKNRCKISDYGDNTLIPSQALHSCSSPSGFSLYTATECYKTGVITHMSDVYSFGVIILQLVTGITKRRIVSKVRKAISMGKTASILDLSAGDWSTYVGRRLLELGLQCCGPNSRDRPDLSPSLVRELECMPFLEEQTVPSFFLCPILREIMHDPQVAADGFTYEGDALRGWLEGGRETSPMTNLKLSHLDLTPNYSLRLAIQDWAANLEIAD
ncbi:U-box domain-containing protein 33 [Phtheirospermum japonicum]|uniref:RING-type E3 ubiquitin transferase n=1 Tax=Phtheirospermum japonicum TaxID=374723 RepID=A0A830D6Z8_9LAMI|nr:U-box domain-containing protein 33 [Phtheirospermum japonicum]